MFGIGFGEILLVLVILIIFIRPSDLPRFLRKAGILYGKAKRLYKEIMEVKDGIIKEMDKAASDESASDESVSTEAGSDESKN